MSNINDFDIQNGILSSYKGNDEDVVIPAGVWGIRSRAFSRCESLKNITIPDGVTAIGYNVFSECINLKSINYPASMSYIPQGFCSKCSSLESFNIPESVTSIGWNAFEECKNLKSIEIPDNVILIGKGTGGWRPERDLDGTYPYIFHKDTLVIFNNYIKDIEKNNVSERMIFKNTPINEIRSTNAKRYAVHGFLSVEDLSVYGDGVVDSYQKYLKGKIVNYINFILENDVEMIIKRLASLELLDNKFVEEMLEKDMPERAKAILLDYAAKGLGNKEKTSEKKPLTVTELKKIWSFVKNEEGLTITSYKGVDTNVVVPAMIGKNAVTEIDYEAFAAWKYDGIRENQAEARRRIVSITLPDSVTSIGEYAFRECISMNSISLPNSVERIGACAFLDCESLTEIRLSEYVSHIGIGAFYRCNRDLTIIAPAGSYAEEYARRFNIQFKIADT